VTVPLRFLGGTGKPHDNKGAIKFQAKIYEDGATPTTLNESSREVTAMDSLTLKLAPSGGAAVRFTR